MAGGRECGLCGEVFADEFGAGDADGGLAEQACVDGAVHGVGAGWVEPDFLVVGALDLEDGLVEFGEFADGVDFGDLEFGLDEIDFGRDFGDVECGFEQDQGAASAR